MSFYIADEDGTQILVFRCGGAEVTLNDIVKVEGVVTLYNSSNQITSGTSTILEEGVYEEPTGENVVVITISDYATANSWANSTQYATITADEYTTITAAGGQNTGKFYTNGNNWRIYQTESATLTITSTKTIAKVVIEYASQNTGVLTQGTTTIATGAEVEVNGTTITFGIGNSSADVSNGQARISKITIYYAE